MAMKKQEIFIKTDYITLGQFLKFAGIISNGFEAKIFIPSNEIFVDNELETKRGRKLYDGMTIVINGNEFIVRKEK